MSEKSNRIREELNLTLDSPVGASADDKKLEQVAGGSSFDPDAWYWCNHCEDYNFRKDLGYCTVCGSKSQW